MLIPMFNVVCENVEGYSKTILLNLDDMSLLLKDFDEKFSGNSEIELLSPLNLDANNKLRFDTSNLDYEINLKASVSGKVDGKIIDFLDGIEKSICLIKYPSLEYEDKYEVREIVSYIDVVPNNSTEEGIISISISLFQKLTRSYLAEKIISERARDRVDDVLLNEDIDKLIAGAPINYRYTMFNGKSFLLNTNLYSKCMEAPFAPIVTADFSIFDYLSIDINLDIIYYMQKGKTKNIKYILTQNQLDKLMEYKFKKSTWEKYIKDGKITIK